MKDGRTVRVHVQAGYRRDPIAFAQDMSEATPQAIPPCVAQARAAFAVLSSQRGAGMSGPHPLALSDVRRIADVTGVPLTLRETGWLLTMDRAFMAACNHG